MRIPEDAITVLLPPSKLLLSLDRKLEQFYDEAESAYWLRFHPRKKVEGPPLHVHGGYLATLLDEAMGASAWLNGHPVLTHKLNVEYRKPVPIGKVYSVRSVVVEKQKRRIITKSELTDEEGQVLSRATADFFTVDFTKLGKIPNEFKMFHIFHEMRQNGKSVGEALEELYEKK